jgi:hypothetical protein
MRLNAAVLTFREFVMKEELPLASIHAGVFEFLRDRHDALIFGAQAVNAYVDEPRMTQDVDLMSTRAADLAEELRAYLNKRFYIALRVRKIRGGKGYRIYQVLKSGNRHLVDIRAVKELPSSRRIEEVLVMEPTELVASKVISYYQRRGKPKSGTDWRDITMLLLAFPELKDMTSPVTARLQAAGVKPTIMAVWEEFVKQEIQAADEEEDEDEWW